MRKTTIESTGVVPAAHPIERSSGSSAAPTAGTGVPVAPSSKGIEFFLNAIADTIVDRLEHRQAASRRVLDMDQTVEYLGASEDTIYRLVAEGKLTPVRFDRRTRFDVHDLDKLVADSKAKDQY